MFQFLCFMTKEELINSVAKKAGVSKAEAGRCLNAILEEITKELTRGRKIALTGFGVFSVSKRKARTGVNPRTGEKIKIPATKVPKFKAGKSLKDAVR